jgi:hypothetical protein
MSEAWIAHRDGDAGFAVDHPSGWEAIDGVAGSDVLVLASESGTRGFRANLAVATQMRPDSLDLKRFGDAQLATLAQLLTDGRLVDRAPASLLGQPGERVLITYRQGIHSLTLEQWWAVAGEGAVVVSATCAALDYDLYADTFAGMAASLRVLVCGTPDDA